MPWQKIVRHVSNQRVIVQNKSGKEYPVEVEREYLGEIVYSQLTNRKSAAGSTLWGWIDFSGEDPVLDEVTRGGEGDGPPDDPPGSSFSCG